MTSLQQLERVMRQGSADLQRVSAQSREVLSAADRAALARRLARTEADLRRRSLRVGVLPLAGIHAARFVQALLDARLLPPHHALCAGPRIRVRHAERPDLRATGPVGSPFTWSDAHPDPRPTIQAKATALNAERMALTEEDGDLARAVDDVEARVARMQQDVLGLSASVSEARALVQRRVHAHDQARERSRATQARLQQVLQELPRPLREEGREGLRGLTASVLSGFHTDTLARVQALRARARTVEREEEEAAAEAEDAQARLLQAKERLDAHSARLGALRAQLSAARDRRDRLRLRAGQLTRARVGLAHTLDKVASTRRRSFRKDLAAQVEAGAQRLWLDWPTPHLPPRTTLLLADGTAAPEPELRQRADDWLADRADVLMVAIDLARPLAPPERQRLRRLLRSVPVLLPVLVGVERVVEEATRRGDEDPEEAVEDARAAAVRRLARQLGMSTPPRAVGLALDALLDPRRDEAERERHHTAFSRELTTVLQALRDGPRVARPARLALGLRDTAQAIESAMRAEDAAVADRRAALTAQQLRDPVAFRAEARRAAGTAGPQLAASALDTAHAAADRCLSLRFDAARSAVRAAGPRELRRLQASLSDDLEQGLGDDMLTIEDALRAGAERAQSDLLAGILGPLADRVREAAIATQPGTEATEAPTGALATDMAELLRARSPSAPGGELQYALLGGAIGAVLTGGLAGPVLLALGAGALAKRLGAAPDQQREELLTWLDTAQTSIAAEVHRRLEQRRDELARLGPTTAMREVMDAIDRFEQWMNELVLTEAERDQERRTKRTALRSLRNTLVARASELETILETARLPGVVWRAPWTTELPPPPPPE